MKIQFAMPSQVTSSLLPPLRRAAPVVPAETPEAPPPPRRQLDPEAIHPTLWRAHQLGRRHEAGLPTGFAALDAELPGGGWPARMLTELLLSQAGIGELRLLVPALRQVSAAGRIVMLFDPPLPLCAPGLMQLGLALPQLVVVHGRAGLRGPAQALLPSADVLWALEQALKSGHVGAVLAWLPLRLGAQALRRLQLAAQSHDGPAFLLREQAAEARPSPAPLRLGLKPAGVDRLQLRLLKRRGPTLPQPLNLLLPAVLPAPLQGRALPVPDGAAAPSAPRRAPAQTAG
jgi:protein ImuA